jgi:uncharacterized tellurite resistance protein B-like protein
MSTPDDAIGLVQALGFIAWSDDRIAPEEREMLSTVMDALGIPPQRREQLCEALAKAPPTLEEISASFTDDMERRFAIAQAILLARADGDFAESERRDIQRLAAALGIDAGELEMIYAAVDVTDKLIADAQE